MRVFMSFSPRGPKGFTPWKAKKFPRLQEVLAPAAAIEERPQLQEAEDEQAKPEVYQGTQVEPIRMMPGAWRKVR
jgi:hypothetical protein